MKLQTLNRRLILLTFTIVLFGTSLSVAQELSKVTIPLKINDQIGAFAGLQIKFGDDLVSDLRSGKASGNTIVAIGKSPDPKFTYQVKVDSDGDGSLEGESFQNIS